jgi:hypothetical protein
VCETWYIKSCFYYRVACFSWLDCLVLCKFASTIHKR